MLPLLLEAPAGDSMGHLIKFYKKKSCKSSFKFSCYSVYYVAGIVRCQAVEIGLGLGHDIDTIFWVALLKKKGVTNEGMESGSERF